MSKEDVSHMAPGTMVDKVGGYPFPGVIVAAFKTTGGVERFVVEATGDGYAGMLHIFNGGQLRVVSATSTTTVGAPSPHTHLSLTFTALQRAHVERQEEWCPDQKPDLSFRGNELGGECGEAQNVIKKLERERRGWRGSRDTVEHLAEELADVIHCAVLVAITAGIEIEPAVIAKFNSTSDKNGLSTFLPRSETLDVRA